MEMKGEGQEGWEGGGSLLCLLTIACACLFVSVWSLLLCHFPLVSCGTFMPPVALLLLPATSIQFNISTAIGPEAKL